MSAQYGVACLTLIRVAGGLEPQACRQVLLSSIAYEIRWCARLTAWPGSAGILQTKRTERRHYRLLVPLAGCPAREQSPHPDHLHA